MSAPDPGDRIRLFRYLDPPEIERVLERCPARKVGKGEFVLRSGEAGDRMYLLESGQVEVLDDRLQEPLVLAQIGPGSFFGEIALLDGQRRTKDVRALTDCRVRELSRDDFLRLYQDDPGLFAKLSRALNEVLSSRLRGTLQEDDPLIRYIRRLQRSEPRPAPAPPRPREADERLQLERLYQAILRAKRELFALADDLGTLPPAEVLARGAPPAARALGSLLAQVERALDDDPGRERLGQVKRLFLQEMYPCLMRSPTIDRAYLKPRGYSLDAEMLERIHRGEADGADTLGLLVDRFALDRPLLAALRRRIDDAADFLRRAAAACDRDEVRVVCIGCGPALEVIEALRAPAMQARATFTCIDPDGQALAALGERAARAGVRGRLRLLEADVIGMLDHPDPLRGSDADLIYGLTILDRLDDEPVAALLAAAHGALRDGGELRLAATSTDDPSGRFAEIVLEWFPRRRTPGDLRALLAESRFPGERCGVDADPLGVNLVARARR